MNPIRTIHSSVAQTKSSALPSTCWPTLRKPSNSELFERRNWISFYCKTRSLVLTTLRKIKLLLIHKSTDFLVYYKIIFDATTGFPEVVEAGRVVTKLKVKQQYRGDNVPVRAWFVDGNNPN